MIKILEKILHGKNKSETERIEEEENADANVISKHHARFFI